MTDANTRLPEPDVLLGAALFLMTKHAQSHCPGTCRAIAPQFGWLARHPAPIAAEQRRLYQALSGQWAEMAAARAVRPVAEPLLAAPGSWLQ
jgi:hypothetical protein